MMDIVSWTFANQDYDQDTPLYIDSSEPSRYLSAGQNRTLVRQLVAGFSKHGLERGDCVCVVSFNDIHYSSLYLGIIGAGGCFSGANPGYTSYELTHHLRITEAKFVVTQLATLDISIAAADECGIPHSNIFIFNIRGEDELHSFSSWKSLLDCGEADWISVEDPDETPVAYVSTSGTSGLPKAAILTHAYMVSQAEIQARGASTAQKVSYLVALPPFHVFMIPIQHALPLRKGIPVYVMPRYETQSFVKAVDKYKITRTVLVPPILTSLSKSPFSTEKALKSLRRLFVGGSCAGSGMQEQLYTKLSPAARIEHVYGMTESGWATTTWRDRKRDTTGSVGTPVQGTELRLVGRDGKVLTKEGAKGEIHIRNRNLMKGYLNNAKATAEAFSPDGWICSGDVGFVRGGKWFVVDRTKDLIKVRGWQVSPAEIECAMLEHPDVIDAAVIGVMAHDYSGEVPRAFIVKKGHSPLSEREVKAFLGSRLARYKAVEKVDFVDSIPRNPTGKILRRILRDAIANPKEDITSSDEEVTQAYTKAIRELEEAQQKRASCDICSRTSNMSDTSTVMSTSSLTSPVTARAVPTGGKERKRKRGTENDWMNANNSVRIKRRSNRVAVLGAVRYSR